MAHVLTDEAFALSLGHFSRIGRTDERGYWIAAIALDWIPWNVGTLVGATVGGEIPDPNRFGLDVVFAASMVGLAVGLARPCFGSTLALRRQTLGAIGGFKPFINCLADDYAMGEALRSRGCTISIPPFAIAHMCTLSSPREFWHHELRWARTIKSIDPVGYAGSIVAHPLPWALIAALLGAGSIALVPAIAIAVASIVCRMALLRQVERAYALPPQAYWLVPARDVLSFILFVVSFLGRSVSWKGYRYRIVAGESLDTDRGSDAP